MFEVPDTAESCGRGPPQCVCPQFLLGEIMGATQDKFELGKYESRQLELCQFDLTGSGGDRSTSSQDELEIGRSRKSKSNMPKVTTKSLPPTHRP